MSPPSHSHMMGSMSSQARVTRQCTSGMLRQARPSQYCLNARLQTWSVKNSQIWPQSYIIIANDKTVQIWDIETGQTVSGPFERYASIVLSVAISHDGRRVVSGLWDKTVRIWDIETGQTDAGPLRGTWAWSPLSHSRMMGSVLSQAHGTTQSGSGTLRQARLCWVPLRGTCTMSPKSHSRAPAPWTQKARTRLGRPNACQDPDYSH